MNLYSRKTINEIRNRYGFKNTKSLGQNFLTDKGVIDAIIDATDIGEEDLVIEIGPGIGVLTHEAAKLAKKVVAVEMDANLIPILNETLAGFDNVEIINQDVLKTDLNAIIEESGCKKAKIIGNLPYYITTPIIMELLEKGVKAECITIMMQKEVADRIVSEPGNRIYGALSVAVQYYCEVEVVAKVPKDVFIPVPKVDSEVLKLIIRPEHPVNLLDEDMFFQCVKAGFGQRRKTIANSLTGTGFDKNKIMEILERLDIADNRRAETLSMDDFAAIANALTEEKSK